MVFDSYFQNSFKFLRLPLGQYVVIWMILIGELLSSGAAWGLSSVSDLKPYNLQLDADTLSDSATFLSLEQEPTSVLPTISPSDSAILNTQLEPQRDSAGLLDDQIHDVLYLAAPENLNPGLYTLPLPDPASVIPESITPESIEPSIVTPDAVDPDTLAPTSESVKGFSIPDWDIDGLTVNLSDDFSNFGQGNRIIEPVITGTFPNGDRLTVTTGFNRYAQPDVDTVFNVPLKAAWTGEMGDFTTTAGGGVDLFNQLPIAPNLNASTSVPIGKKATLSFFADYGPYKFNATTLNNQITALRYGPNLYWQIEPDLYLFSLVRWGRYNDGNYEQQSFSRLEQSLGDFYAAGNLFTWRYRENAEAASGYFSPPDFLVANAEIGWKGEVLEWLDCGTSASWGRQRLNSSWSSAYSYNAMCTLDIAESLEIDLGYALSNVIAETGGSAFNNRAITGQVRAKF